MQANRSKTTFIVLIIIIICGFSAATLFTYFTTKARLKNEIIYSSLPLLGENIYSEVRQSLSIPLNVSSAMSHDSFLVNWVLNGEADARLVTQYLQNIRDKYNFFSTFYVSSITGKYYYYGGILKQLSPENEHDQWYYIFTETGKDVDLDVDTNEASNGVLTIFINCRLTDFNGNYLGAVGVGVKLNQLAELLKEKQERYESDIFLVDENAIIQVHPNLELVEQVNIFEAEGISDVASDLMSETDEPVDRVFKKDGDNILVSSRYIPELDWHIFIQQNENDSLYEITHGLKLSIFVIIIIAALLGFASYQILKSFRKSMETLAGTDDLTQVANRRELNKYFDIYMYRQNRYNTPFSVLLIDLDNFKNVNDVYGHLEGDLLLKDLAKWMTNIIRTADLLIRWGGDEFVLILEAPLGVAKETAERLRKYAEAQFSGKGVTLSIGVAQYAEGDSLDTIVRAADNAMYKSKSGGKNQVTIAER